MSSYEELKSLNKIKVEKKIGSISSGSKIPINDFKAIFDKLVKKAKKEGYENISVDFEADYGDENTLASSGLILMGTRLETEEEWHKRLEHTYNTNKRIVEQAERVIKVSKTYLDENDEIQHALSKSSLRCCDCGKPCSYTTYTGGKSKRICNDCCMKR